MAHRYWRWIVSFPRGGSDNTQYAEIEFRGTIGGAEQAGTFTASSQFSGSFAIGNAFDNNPATSWAAIGNIGNWVQGDFGSPVEFAELGILTSASNGNQCALAFFVQYSDNGTDWVDYDYIFDAAANPGSGATRAYTIAGAWPAQGADVADAHRYWRINTLSCISGFQQINEIVFKDDADTDLTVVHGGSPFASNAQGSFPASYAFDRIDANRWATVSDYVRRQIGWDFGAGNEQAVTKYSLKAHTGSQSGMPRGWALEYSDNNTDWFLADTRLPNNVSAWASNESREFEISIDVPVEGITAVAPNEGLTAGDEPVTIIGVGFTDATGVLFDTDAATDVVVVSDTEITCNTPAHAAGLVDVTVERAAGDLIGANAFLYTDADDLTYITQIPLLVVQKSNQASLITQIPLLIATLPIQGTLITQVPILAAFLPTPIPLPSPVVPEVPVTETWNWLTTVQTAEGSREQRTALREFPRYGMKINALILSEEDRRRVYQLLFKFINREITYPFYQHSTGLTAAAAAAATKLFFDPARTDLRDGETLALFDPQLDATHYLTIDAIEADGATLAAPLPFAVPASWLVCPAIPFRVPASVGLNMRALDGSLTLQMESTRPRAFVRPGASPTALTTLNNLPILTARPLADDDVEEAFVQDVEWLDNGTSIPLAKSSWRLPFVSGERSYSIKRPDDLDYWRQIAEALKGRQNPFLLPTFRDDMPVIEAPALGGKSFVTDNIQYFDYWLEATYRYLQIVTTNGVIYRRVMSAEANYDEAGQPISVNIELDTAFGSSAGDNVIWSISFMNICRLDDDTITLSHRQLETIVSLKIRAINE